MGDLQRKRKSNCSEPDVATILKEFELKKRKGKVNKTIVKNKQVTRLKSKLKSEKQSKNLLLEANEPDTSTLLIRKNCSQSVSKANQDKKVWQPPIRTPSDKDMSFSCKIQEDYDNDYNIQKVKATESTKNCHIKSTDLGPENIIENKTTGSPMKSNEVGQLHEKSLQNHFEDVEFDTINENKESNKNANEMSQEAAQYHICDDNLLKDKNTSHVENGLTVSLSSSPAQLASDDVLYNKQSPHLESQKSNSLETTCTKLTQLSGKNLLHESSEDTSEKLYSLLCAEKENTQNGIHTSDENIITISPFSPNAAQNSKQYLYDKIQEKCLNNTSQTKIAKNSAQYEDEYDDEDITITHSQLNHIENEFSKNRNSTVPTSVHSCSNTTKQSLYLQYYASPSFKVMWNKKIEEDGKKLRQIVQELRKINESLLKIRNEVWPSRNNFSSLPGMK